MKEEEILMPECENCIAVSVCSPTMHPFDQGCKTVQIKLKEKLKNEKK